MTTWCVLGLDLGLGVLGHYCPCILGQKGGKIEGCSQSHVPLLGPGEMLTKGSMCSGLPPISLCTSILGLLGPLPTCLGLPPHPQPGVEEEEAATELACVC